MLRRNFLGAAFGVVVASGGSAQASGLFSPAVPGIGLRVGVTLPPAAGAGFPGIASVIGAQMVDATFTVPVDGWVAAITFQGMAAQPNGALDDNQNFVPVSGFDPSSLVLFVRDAGFDSSGNPTNVFRTIRGTLPLRRPFPVQIAAGTIPADSFGSNVNGTLYYYTNDGGTQTSSLPTHTIGTQMVGGVSWTAVPIQNAPGYFQSVSGSDVTQYAALDGPVFQGTTIVSASIGAGAYIVGDATSPGGSIAITPSMNASALPYEFAVCNVLTPPHFRSTGSLTVEFLAYHMAAQNAQEIACVKGRAWNLARTVPSPDVLVNSPSLSTLVETSSPGGRAVEVWSATFDTTGIPYGDCFVEYEIYPWLGTQVFISRIHGEGADWQPNIIYSKINEVHRNGSMQYYLTASGTSASSGGPTGNGSEIVDGTCIWASFGADMTKKNSANPQARHHFFNDPSNVYKKGYAFVDPVNGTATGTAGVFNTFVAANGAKADPAKCYPTVSAAGIAIQNFNNTVSSGVATHNDPGGGEIYMKAGVYGSGYGSNMQTLNIGSEWLYVFPDPEAASGTVVWKPTSASGQRACSKRMWHEGMTWSGASNALAAALQPISDNSTVPTQPVTEVVMSKWTCIGLDTSGPFIFGAGQSWIINCTINNAFVCDKEGTRAHTALVAGNLIAAASGVTGNLTAASHVLVGNTLHGVNMVRDARALGIPARMFAIWADNYFTGYAANAGGTAVSMLNASAGAGTVLPYLGAAYCGNLNEVLNTGGAADTNGAIAGDASTGGTWNVLIHNNTHVGERTNRGYSDANVTDIRTRWYEANNIFYDDNIVDDFYFHGTPVPSRQGLRAKNWWLTYAVGMLQNCNFGGTTNGPLVGLGQPSGLRRGIRCKFGVAASTAGQFVNDASRTGTSLGFGDYHPLANSQAAGMALVQTRKYAADGALRRTDGTGAVGCYEVVS